jgi:hypothetical protein
MDLDAIFINSAADTSCYDILAREVNGTVLVNPTWGEATELLENSQRDIIIFGHGTEWGVFTDNFSDYLISAYHAELLRRRRVIGIWCFAGNFAARHDLHGFFTSMFISNVNESIVNERPAEPDDIERELRLFLERIAEYIRTNVPMEEWVDRLHAVADWSQPFVAFNYECLSYLE